MDCDWHGTKEGMTENAKWVRACIRTITKWYSEPEWKPTSHYYKYYDAKTWPPGTATVP
jgi:hypothetical protein